MIVCTQDYLILDYRKYITCTLGAIPIYVYQLIRIETFIMDEGTTISILSQTEHGCTTTSNRQGSDREILQWVLASGSSVQHCSKYVFPGSSVYSLVIILMCINGFRDRLPVHQRFDSIVLSVHIPVDKPSLQYVTLSAARCLSVISKHIN